MTEIDTRPAWLKLASEIRFRTEAFIGGEYVAAASGETFPSINPATGELLAEVSSCDSVDVDAAVRSARASFEKGDWSRAAPVRRKETLLRLADLLETHKEELALTDSLDMGKLVSAAVTADVPHTIGVMNWYAEAIDKIYGEIAPAAQGELGLVSREPVGVVAAVVPWNFPLAMAAWKVAPALAAGNSVILKPAEQSPLSALRLGELAVEAGIPHGVLNVVPGFGDRAGQALGRHPDVDCVSFTGSTEVGKLFLRYSAESNMKQVWLECGGKSPNLVFADAEEMSAAAEGTCASIFNNQGEVCSAHSRLLVAAEIADAFLEELIPAARKYHPGDPLEPSSTLGALVDEHHTQHVMAYIEDGKHAGELLLGGRRVDVNGTGCFVEPTIFAKVPLEHSMIREEIFGPVLNVMTFATEDEAVERANDSRYGLSASVWTQNISTALRVASRLRAGAVSVNAVDVVNIGTPFGGVKESGFGRDLSLHALEKYTSHKTTWIRY